MNGTTYLVEHPELIQAVDIPRILREAFRENTFGTAWRTIEEQRPDLRRCLHAIEASKVLGIEV